MPDKVGGMDTVTAQMRRGDDNHHEKIDSASDHQSGTKGYDHLLCQTCPQRAKLEEWLRANQKKS